MRKRELAGSSGASASAQVLALVERDLDRAYRLAGLVLGNSEDARDATHDAVLRAWRHAAALRDPARFQAWFDRILVNACRDQLRRRSRIRFIPIDEGAAEARDPFHRILEQAEVLRHLASLDEDLRLVVVLHYWADLRLEAVAERTGWPVGTVKSRLHRALEQLRRLGDATGERDRER